MRTPCDASHPSNGRRGSPMLRSMDARRNSCSYSDDDFEKDEDDSGWTRISIKDIDMGREIGGGGVALVYEGYYRNEPVALKTLFDPKVDAALQKEYLDELLVMASLKHKNVVRFIGGCVDPPDLFFVMERCECSLHRVIHGSKSENVAPEKLSLADKLTCLLYTSPSPRDGLLSRMPSSA